MRNDMFMNKFIFLGILGACMFNHSVAMSQETNYALSETDLREIVLRFHPIAREGVAMIRQASGEKLAARGAFDPRVQHEQAEKTFDGIEYYRYRRTVWQIPTWFGIEVRGGWEYLQGARTPETETLGTNNYVGLSIPLLKGLSMDKRRTDLRKAAIALDASRNERDRLVNEVLGEALIQYWDWVRYHQLEATVDSLRQINRTRLNLIRASVKAGDRAATDTIEANAQLNQWELAYQEARLGRQKAQWKLSDHLWTEKGDPYFLPESVVPDPMAVARFREQTAIAAVEQWIEPLSRTNLDWIGLNFQLKQFRIDRSFYRQELLPSVRLEYNQLGQDNNLVKTLQQPWWQDQFRYGLKMSIPLRLSSERGQLRSIEGKIQQTEWKQDWLLWKTTNRIRIIHAELIAIAQQTSLQQQMLKQYADLLSLEWLRFRQGESSLFLVNARESRYQDTRQKLLDLQFKFRKARIEIEQVSGQLIQ
jgi:outer membrane protein TolC